MDRIHLDPNNQITAELDMLGNVDQSPMLGRRNSRAEAAPYTYKANPEHAAPTPKPAAAQAPSLTHRTIKTPELPEPPDTLDPWVLNHDD